VRELVGALEGPVPAPVREIASGLEYRDFLTVGLLVPRLKIQETRPDGSSLVRDNWIYIQEPDVRVGRLQIFNNWSPFMVADPETVWLGMEYFCNEGDDLWVMDDEALKAFGASELDRIGIIDRASVMDGVIVRMPKAYPGYFGSYHQFDQVRAYLDTLPNLFLIGRNGMHRYNNQDHSMLTAMAAVDLVATGGTDKAAIWEVNTEDEYHETAKAEAASVAAARPVMGQLSAEARVPQASDAETPVS
jgi:protoporphyrinogen oxidase